MLHPCSLFHKSLSIHLTKTTKLEIITVKKGKIPLDNFHLQYPSTIIHSSEMPQKYWYLPITYTWQYPSIYT